MAGKNNQLATISEPTKLDNFTNVEELMKWAGTVIDSGLLPDSITMPEQVLTIVQCGRELGLSPHIALNNINVIAGRPVISSTMLGAMLKRKNIEWIIEEDFATIQTPEGGADKRTTYRFYWKSDVTGAVMNTAFSITWAQMAVAGYVSKQNWQKYPKEMMRARCMAYAVRALFPDVLLGMYTDLEMNDTQRNDAPVNITEDGAIVIESQEPQEAVILGQEEGN